MLDFRRHLMASGALLAALAASPAALAEPAAAPRAMDDPKTERSAQPLVTCAGIAVFPIDGELECVPPPRVAVPARADRPALPTEVEPDRRSAASYRAVLDDLAIARDLPLPGVPVGVRLIPSRTALSGRSAPIALIPRFVGTSWYGAEIVASF